MLTTFKQFNEGKGGRTSIVWHSSPNSNLFRLKATGSNKNLQAVNMNESGIYICPKFQGAVNWFLSYVSGKKDSRHGLNTYKEGTIYKIEIPTVILEKSWYSEDWEPEYFITEDNIKYLKIISKKTYSIKELKTIENGFKNNKKRFISDIVDKRYEKNYALLTLKRLKSILYDLLLKKGFKNSYSYKKLNLILKSIEELIHKPNNELVDKYEQEFHDILKISQDAEEQ